MKTQSFGFFSQMAGETPWNLAPNPQRKSESVEPTKRRRNSQGFGNSPWPEVYVLWFNQLTGENTNV